MADSVRERIPAIPPPLVRDTRDRHVFVRSGLFFDRQQSRSSSARLAPLPLRSKLLAALGRETARELRNAGGLRSPDLLIGERSGAASLFAEVRLTAPSGKTLAQQKPTGASWIMVISESGFRATAKASRRPEKRVRSNTNSQPSTESLLSLSGLTGNVAGFAFHLTVLETQHGGRRPELLSAAYRR